MNPNNPLLGMQSIQRIQETNQAYGSNRLAVFGLDASGDPVKIEATLFHLNDWFLAQSQNPGPQSGDVMETLSLGFGYLYLNRTNTSLTMNDLYACPIPKLVDLGYDPLEYKIQCQIVANVRTTNLANEMTIGLYEQGTTNLVPNSEFDFAFSAGAFDIARSDWFDIADGLDVKMGLKGKNMASGRVYIYYTANLVFQIVKL